MAVFRHVRDEIREQFSEFYKTNIQQKGRACPI